MKLGRRAIGQDDLFSNRPNWYKQNIEVVRAPGRMAVYKVYVYPTFHIMFLAQPNDIILLMLRCLSKRDLLTCRLLCWDVRVLLDSEPYAWSLLLLPLSWDESITNSSFLEHTFLFPSLKRIIMLLNYFSDLRTGVTNDFPNFKLIDCESVKFKFGFLPL
jgi:hypothetical protein